MALAKQILEIPLGAGVDTKSDPKVVGPGSLLVAENGEFTEPGAIRKRNGYTALTKSRLDGGNISAGAMLATYRDQLVAFDGDYLYTYASTAAGWAQKGRCRLVGAKTNRIGLGSVNYATSVDVASTGGITVYAWKNASGANASVIDEATGAEIQSGTNVDSASDTQVRVVASGAYIYLVFVRTANVRMYALNTASPGSWASVVNIATDAGGGRAFDVGSLGSGNAVCAYETSSNEINVIKFNSTGATDGPTTIAENPASQIGVTVTAAQDIHLAYRQATTNYVRCTALDSDLASLFSPATIETDATADMFVGVENVTDTVQWIYNATASSSYRRVRYFSVDNAGSASSADVMARSVSVASRPFVYGSFTYFLAHYASQASVVAADVGDAAYLLMDTDGNVCGRVLTGNAPSEALVGIAGSLWPSSAVALASGRYVFGVPAAYSQNVLIDSDDYTVGGLVPIPTWAEFDFTFRGEPAESRETLYIPGAQLNEFDGGRVHENNFHCVPYVQASTAGTGGSLSDGSWQFAVVFAYFDGRGEIHWSAPSVPVTVTLSGGGSAQKITLVIPYLRLTAKESVRVFVYATEDGGSTLYEISEQYNDPTTDAFTLEITSTLLTGITDNRILYTNGGVLENGPAPAMQSVVRRGKRLYGVSHDGVVHYSKERVTGEGAAFVPETLVTSLVQDGSDEWRLAVMDGNLVAVSERGIQIVTGDGFNDVGVLGNLSEPQVIATDVGLIAKTPVLSTKEGVYFRSRKGICRLGRSLEVEYVGAPVEGYNSLTMVSAALVPTKNQIRFGHSDGSTLVYDYLLNRWSVFTNHNQVGAAYWGSTYCLLKSDGTVWQQSTGFEDPSSTAITMAVETPWAKLSALQGFQRVFYVSVLGEWRSAHTLSLKTHYNYEPSAAETKTFNAATGFTPGQPLQVRHHLGKKCTAAKWRIEDSAQAGTKESFALTALSLELGGLGGVFRQGSAKTF